MSHQFLGADIASIQAISAVPKILRAVAATTGLRFVCVARVTPDSWHACAVLDQLDFGLKVGDGLDVTTTLCEEVRDTGSAVIIDSVSNSEKYRDHHTPRIYGFQSYFSIPLFRPNGDYFGTLCGLDPEPSDLSNESTTTSMTLFAELISLQLHNDQRLSDTQIALLDERTTAELREQFIAVLGHDLRTPLSTIITGTEILTKYGPEPKVVPLIAMMRRSAFRISALVDDMVDFARGRMGNGISLHLRAEHTLHEVFNQVIDELRQIYPGREIDSKIQTGFTLVCDAGRMGQLLSNLVKNALVHGDDQHAVSVVVTIDHGIFELKVTNQGSAIPPEVIAQLFKPFWRSPNSAKDGLGLGLFIVSEIVKSHGGHIEVVSSAASTAFIYTTKVNDVSSS